MKEINHLSNMLIFFQNYSFDFMFLCGYFNFHTVKFINLSLMVFELYVFKILVAQSCLTLVTPWTVAPQAPLSMGFFRQEYWSRVPFPSPGDLPDSGIKPTSPALQADSLLSEPPRLFYVFKAFNSKITGGKYSHI